MTKLPLSPRRSPTPRENERGRGDKRQTEAHVDVVAVDRGVLQGVRALHDEARHAVEKSHELLQEP